MFEVLKGLGKYLKNSAIVPSMRDHAHFWGIYEVWITKVPNKGGPDNRGSTVSLNLHL